jgi:hypothetical protein
MARNPVDNVRKSLRERLGITAEAVPIYQPKQDLVSETLPTQPPSCLDDRVGLVGPEVITANMRNFVG